MADDAPDPKEVPSRSDLQLFEQAIRQDWAIPYAVKRKVLQTCINLIDEPEPLAEGQKPIPKRTKLAAMKVLAQYGKLSIEQQKLDLARQKHEGKGKRFVLSEVVAEAERIAAEHSPAEKPS